MQCLELLQVLKTRDDRVDAVVLPATLFTIDPYYGNGCCAACDFCVSVCRGL